MINIIILKPLLLKLDHQEGMELQQILGSKTKLKMRIFIISLKEEGKKSENWSKLSGLTLCSLRPSADPFADSVWTTPPHLCRVRLL